MITPTQKLEEDLYTQGYRQIAGVDEAGRGAWAGPIVSAAVIMPRYAIVDGIRDSKLLSLKRREELYEHILEHALAWAVGIIDADEIDRRGIEYANKQSMIMAVSQLAAQADFVVTDGNRGPDFGVPSKTIIDGDALVYSIAAASIIAKVTRDRLMREAHALYPAYGFEQHVGYGTTLHQQMIEEHGPTPLHRKSFQPIRRLIAAVEGQPGL